MIWLAYPTAAALLAAARRRDRALGRAAHRVTFAPLSHVRVVAR